MSGVVCQYECMCVFVCVYVYVYVLAGIPPQQSHQPQGQRVPRKISPQNCPNKGENEESSAAVMPMKVA